MPRPAKQKRQEEEEEDDDDAEEEGEEEEEEESPAPPSAPRVKPSLKASPGFSALNNRLMGAGRVHSVHLNLHSAASSSNSSSSSSSSGSGSSGGRIRRNAVEAAQEVAGIYDPKALDAPPLKPPRPAPKKTLGKGWFDLAPAVLDDKMKRDMKMIQMRNYIDPKRFYKNPDKSKAVLHVGTVIEGPGEYKSSRLTNRERRTTIVGEILADKQVKQYTKRKYLEIQADKPQRKRKSFKKGRR